MHICTLTGHSETENMKIKSISFFCVTELKGWVLAKTYDTYHDTLVTIRCKYHKYKYGDHLPYWFFVQPYSKCVFLTSQTPLCSASSHLVQTNEREEERHSKIKMAKWFGEDSVVQQQSRNTLLLYLSSFFICISALNFFYVTTFSKENRWSITFQISILVSVY